MAIDKKYHFDEDLTLRDMRGPLQKIRDSLKTPGVQLSIFALSALAIHLDVYFLYATDVILVFNIFYFWWLYTRPLSLPAKLPKSAGKFDMNNTGPGRSGKAEGILYIGSDKKTKEEIWYTDGDARTHILYLGTTGSGKTEGLKSLITNAMSWGSGFVYIDGKADTNLWSSVSALARRFGRDDDLLVLNYMTGNRDGGSVSNTMNPFSGGSASYLTNLMVSLMPAADGDNAMWKERAVALIGSLMPALTWKRDHQDEPFNVGTIRKALNMPEIIKLARDPDLPERIRFSLQGYLDTLPGYDDSAFDDDGKERPNAGDTSVASQQHGYLSMQFTRSLQSLADDYGYIFERDMADIDMMDVVLNRRLLITLIPALEKSGDEAANLGKIVAATIKGMMGSTLGSEIEGDVASTIENKPSQSATPFMAVFDEVGYYTAEGMGVMAAQARSLGFSLVFSAQDLPALEKKIKEEARSIAANCSIKIFGKLEDPTQTKEFFEKTMPKIDVAMASGYSSENSGLTDTFYTKKDVTVKSKAIKSYGAIRGYKEGEAVVTYGKVGYEVNIFYSDPGAAKSMRVQKFLYPPKPDKNKLRQKEVLNKLLDQYKTKGWTAKTAIIQGEEDKTFLEKTIEGFKIARKAEYDFTARGAVAIACFAEDFKEQYLKEEEERKRQEEARALHKNDESFSSVETGDESNQDFSWDDLMSEDDDDDDDDDDFNWDDLIGDDGNNSSS